MTTQAIAALISFIGIAGLVGVYLFVVARSGELAPYAEVQPRAYALRRNLFIVLLVGFFLVPALTLRHLPYSPGSADTTVVEITAHQWYWELSRSEFAAGEPILFRVASEDVNHGFAIYDASNRIVAQVQAMPGYVNELALRFDEPGTYKVMCLEYCGVAHHGMLASLDVTGSQEAL